MRWLTWAFLDRHRDLGLLLLRVGIGGMFLAHGVPKLMGGPAKWEALGGAMGRLGITFLPAVWGLAAGLAEAVGGVLLILGLATRPAAVTLAFTMFVAWFAHFSKGDGFNTWSHAAEAGILFLALAVMGAGRYALDARLRR